MPSMSLASAMALASAQKASLAMPSLGRKECSCIFPGARVPSKSYAMARVMGAAKPFSNGFMICFPFWLNSFQANHPDLVKVLQMHDGFRFPISRQGPFHTRQEGGLVEIVGYRSRIQELLPLFIQGFKDHYQRPRVGDGVHRLNPELQYKVPA